MEKFPLNKFSVRSLNSLISHYCAEILVRNEVGSRTALANTIRNINNNVSSIMDLFFVLTISSRPREKLIASAQTEIGNLKLGNYAV